jgi:hypothetical protein
VATAAAGTVEASGVGVVEEMQRVDLLKDIPGAQRAKHTKMEAYSRRKPPAPASQVRKSSRINGEASEPIMDKAQRLVAEKNLDKERGTDHVILDLHSDSHLSSVIRDSCVVFNPAAGTPGEILSMIRAKKQLQAALAVVRQQQEAAAASKAEAARLAAEREAGVAAGAATPNRAGGEGSPTQEPIPAVQEREFSGPEDAGEARDLETAKGRPIPARGRPKWACAKRPVLTVRKGQGKRKGSK